jgi:hypothetical protein
MRRRAALAAVLGGIAVCVAADLYLRRQDSSSGFDPLIIGWNVAPFVVLGLLILVTRVTIAAGAVAAGLMAGLVAFAFWAEASDLKSSDPSSTGSIILGVPPFYDVAIVGVVFGIDAVVRRVRRRPRER